MRMAHEFGAERLAAQHCAELVARGPQPEERAAQIAGWRRDVARRLGATLGGLLGGERLSAEVSAPEWVSGSDVLTRIGPVAANSLLRCGGDAKGSGAGAEVLLSLDHATALALAERSFGGEGRVGEPSSDPLPRSAQLLCDEVAALIACALAEAREGDTAEPGSVAGGEVIIRSESAARLRAFEASDKAVLFSLRLSDARGFDWHLTLALGAARLDQLLPPASLMSRVHETHAAPDPAASFGGIPLSLCAVLAEFDLTLGQLDRLAPGDTFPLALARSVPLRIGAALVGHGSIGTIEDRMALCLTRLPHQGIPA